MQDIIRRLLPSLAKTRRGRTARHPGVEKSLQFDERLFGNVDSVLNNRSSLSIITRW
jgi:hypothetical protein